MGALDGKVALVTGASRGIGRAIALGLAKHGADVVVTARGVQPGSPFTGTVQATAADIEVLGRRALAVEVDLRDRVQIDALAANALATFGHIDILVNNAAATDAAVFASFWDTDPEMWDRQWAVNVTAPYLLCRALAPGMRERGHGLIINMTSGSGITRSPEEVDADPTGVVYGPSKAGLTRFTVALARDLRPFGITVVPVDPGYTASESAHVQSADFGLDASFAHPVSLPADAVVRIAVSADPMKWSGVYIPSADLASVEA